MSRRVAAVDCGTNSIRLLIADIDARQGVAADLVREMAIVRLGEGVDQTGRLSAAALERTMTALARYARLIDDAGAASVRMVATSATRDAANAAEFTARVRQVLGVAPEVVTGQEEAWLSFTGATRELAGAAAEPGPPYLVTDIGGGSTELVLGDAAGVRASRSVDVGCVRMTERHFRGDPPTAEQVAAATRDVDAALEEVARAVPAAQAGTLVGLAGSVTTIAGIALGLPAYDSAAIHHSRVSAAQVQEIAAALLAQTSQARARIAVMHPGRADVIAGGALILDRIMGRFGFAEVLVSEHDILDGIAWSQVAG